MRYLGSCLRLATSFRLARSVLQVAGKRAAIRAETLIHHLFIQPKAAGLVFVYPATLVAVIPHPATHPLFGNAVRPQTEAAAQVKDKGQGISHQGSVRDMN